MVSEGGTVKLTCKAKGHPVPHIQWRKEDGGDIIIRDPSGHRSRGNFHIVFTKHFFFSVNIYQRSDRPLLRIAGRNLDAVNTYDPFFKS